MGEAKRKRAVTESAPCLCGSGNAAKGCCFDGKEWHKAPAELGLKALPKKSAINKCYMRELNSCEGGISGEHLISESIMALLAGDGEFTVSGLPWIEPGEFKSVGFKSLTANCLCRKHNSCLHVLDDAALKFFRALKSCLDRESKFDRFVVSGHDIERWLLKTLKALAASKNLVRDNQRLSGAFSTDISVLDMLDDPKLWPESAGLYCVMKHGDLTNNHNRFQMAPLTNRFGEIGGLWADIFGLSFVLMLEPLDISENPDLAQSVYRPAQIAISYPTWTSWIAISWEDDREHKNTLNLKFLNEVPA